jgi:hypothetical protein
MLIVIFVLIGYLYYTHYVKPQTKKESNVVIVNAGSPPSLFSGLATRQDPLSDPYSPPMKTDGLYYPPRGGDIRGAIPVNIETIAINTSYQQVGILTKDGGRNGELILPLMGRRTMAGRDKWQYYTMTTTGNMNTKLPISVNGKSCTSEYGCDQVSNGDVVYVEGYNDSFRVTSYENNLFQYIPF